MPHGYAVIDGDGIELGGEASQAAYLVNHFLAYVVKMDVSGDKLSE